MAPSVDAIAATMPTLPERTAVYSHPESDDVAHPREQEPSRLGAGREGAREDDERQDDDEADGHHPREGRHRAQLPARS